MLRLRARVLARRKALRRLREERSEAVKKQPRREEQLADKRADNLTMVFATVSGIVLAMVVTLIHRILGGR